MFEISRADCVIMKSNLFHKEAISAGQLLDTKQDLSQGQDSSPDSALPIT